MAQIPAEIEKILFEYMQALKKEIRVQSTVLFGSGRKKGTPFYTASLFGM